MRIEPGKLRVMSLKKSLLQAQALVKSYTKKHSVLKELNRLRSEDTSL